VAGDEADPVHPLTAAAIVDRARYSTRIKSALDAEDGALTFNNVNTRLVTPIDACGIGWPDLPMKKRGLWLLPQDFGRLEDANDSDIEEWGGAFEWWCFHPRAQGLLLLQEAVRREFNQPVGVAHPNPSAFSTGPTDVKLNRFRMTRKGGIVPPSPEDGYETFRGAVAGVTTERLEEG
jgi:hypothetical protein